MSGRVAIVGVGSSGITAIKCFLDAGFTDLVAYERRDVMGGLWYYKDEAATWVDESSVNKATVINTSKEFMAFSDYPMPDNCPNFCHNTDVEEYFLDYAKHFGADKYVKFNKEVISLKKHSSYDSTGRWELKVKDHKTGEEKVEVFDFVIVSNGHHGEPSIPDVPGLDKFKGKTMHSKDFKHMSGISGEKAVVVGIGNSGGDCSVEVSKYMKVFLATRRGAWVMNRLVKNGMPWDYYFHMRFQTYINSWLPRSFRNQKFKESLNERFNHTLYGMTPVHEPDATHPTLNDELPNRIAAGRIVVKPNLRRFTETGVVFEDNSFEDNIALVIFATGYKVTYPFIEKDILNIKSNKVEMYKNMFLPDLPKQTIAFLAVAQPLGAMFPIAELQSRLAARVFLGEVKLPSPEAMKKDIKAHIDANASRYIQTPRHTIQVDWLPYMDELAVLVGCKPNLLKLLVTDPVLFYHVAFGPGVPYQFRLQGPNTWPGARQAILTTMERIKKPFETRSIPKNQHDQKRSWSRVFLVTSTAALVTTALAVQYLKQNDLDLSSYLPKGIKF